MADLTGQAALVTGGASGIGAAVVRAFAAAGASVVIGDIDAAAGEAMAGSLRNAGFDVLFHQADVTSASSCQAMIDLCATRFGRLGIAVNNVGKIDPPTVPNEILTTDGWDATISLSLSGIYYCVRAELTAMLDAGGGAIVNVASVGGLVSLPRKLAYVSAKHGVIGLTKAVCDAYADRNIRCNAVAPGLIETPGMRASQAKGSADTIALFESRIPSGRLGTAEEVARAILWLASDDAAYVNGATLTIDGGYIVR